MRALRSLVLLKQISKKAAASRSDAGTTDLDATRNEEPTEKKKGRFADWLSKGPEPIKLFDGETEIFRKGLVLVTDTRLAYIDPFDRMLKTFMFEHMISTHKQFYKTSDLNRRLCKGLLVFSLLVLLIIVIIDLLDNDSGSIFLVYIPLIASMLIGLKVWNDMKPRFILHWRMRDMTYGEIVQEPYFRERVLGNNKREIFMVELADAMNEALSRKSWWPQRQQTNATDIAVNAGLDPSLSESDKGKPTLTLVTDSYE